ncbi:MAG: PQQ-like beta-propeller repeat protein [Planctomycetaceae bacterium]|nr:PQQ-like beta-propeller repeat protein [Planctomycetaceae bacterium]
MVSPLFRRVFGLPDSLFTWPRKIWAPREERAPGDTWTALCTCAIVWCLSLSPLTPGTNAADWTEFRGPGGQGHSAATNLPVTWSEEENIRWKAAVPGVGWSSPVVQGDRIFLTTAVSDGEGLKAAQSLRVLCLDAADGKTVWDREVFQQSGGSDVEIHQKNSHASPTPILSKDRLYVHYGSHGTACLQTSDGEIVWQNSDLTYAPQHGNGGSPALVDGVLIICCDGKDERFVTGLDAESGKSLWRTERELSPSRGFSFCTPTLLEAGGRRQAVCPGSGAVWSYDPRTGEQLWRVAYGEGYSVVPRPVIGNGLVYVCSGFGDAQLFAIDPAGTGDVTESHVRWKVKKGVPKSPSVLLAGEDLYMVDDNGVATCLSALTGDVHWQERLGGGFSASPVLADGHIYFQNETGETTVIQPGHSFTEVAKNQIGDGKERTFASFAFLDHAILLRTENHLYRIEKAHRR